MANKSRSCLMLLVASLILFIGLAVTGFVFLARGSIHGVEFSPDDFKSRSFDYTKVFGQVLVRRSFNDVTNPVVDFLRGQGMIPALPKTKTEKSWDLVFDNQTPNTSPDCDAHFLVDALSEYGRNGDYFWTDWTNEHPNICRSFWSRVTTLARNHLYWAIPQLMDLARGFDDNKSKEFDSKADLMMTKFYLDAGLDHQLAGDHTKAIELFSGSISILPSREAMAARADSYNQTGDSEASEKDEAAAKLIKPNPDWN